MKPCRSPGFFERTWAGLALLALLFAGRSSAAPPAPAPASIPAIRFHVLPRIIPVVGYDDLGVPDLQGEILVAVHDLADVPIPNALIVIDMSGCADVRPCTNPHDPDATVDCQSRSVRKFTDVHGEARFRIVGCSIATPGGPGAGANCARIFANWILGGSVPVAIYDLSGCDGLDAGDLAAWLADYFAQVPVARSDYDGDGSIGAGDLSAWLGVFFAVGGGVGSPLNCGPAGHCAP